MKITDKNYLVWNLENKNIGRKLKSIEIFGFFSKYYYRKFFMDEMSSDDEAQNVVLNIIFHFK